MLTTRLTKTTKNQKGFTLIELLVVIGILAVLLAITLIAINPAKQFSQANDTKRRSDVNAILNAIDQFAADNKGSLPANIGAGCTPAAPCLIENTGAATDANICADLTPTYLAQLPTDPKSGDDGTGKVGPVSVCTGAYKTVYTVGKSTTDNRVTVSATSEINPAIPISVTR